ncbi:MAG: glycosyltransferase family 2 protein [Acidimicrobiia bacterium]
MTADGGPEVSIVVVTYRNRDYVLACLRSVAEHVRVSHEVIVVDDGSDDGTADAIRQRYPRARLVAKARNEGLVAGRNTALDLLNGRLVLMLDADTEVCPQAVERLARVLDEQPEVGLVGPKLLYPTGELQLSCRRYPPFLLPVLRRGPYARLNPEPTAHRRHLMMDFDHDTARPVVWLAGAAQMWRADLPKRIGRYDPRVSSFGGEDLDWSLRVWASGLQVWYAPEAQIVHVSQKVTRRSPYGRQSRRAVRDFYYLQFKHWKRRRDPRLAEASR